MRKRSRKTGSIPLNCSGKQEAWILAQPQIRWDAGKTLFNTENKFHLGVELQYWKNKLGTQTDEKAVQLLAVWQL